MRIGTLLGSSKGQVRLGFGGHVWRHISNALCVLILALFCGCASYPRNELPTRSARELSALSPRPAVDCDIHVSPCAPNAAFPNDAGDVAAYSKAVLDALNDSGEFSRVLRGKSDGEYYFDVWVGWSAENESQNFLTGLLRVEVQILSLTVIPTFTIDTCELIVAVHKDGKFIRAYEYHDSVTTWCQLFLVFGTSEIKPRKVKSGVIGNVINNLLFDLRKDNVL